LTTVISTAEQRGGSVADAARFDQARHSGISRSIRAAQAAPVGRKQIGSKLKFVHLSNKRASSQDKRAVGLDGGRVHTSCELLDTPLPLWKTPRP